MKKEDSKKQKSVCPEIENYNSSQIGELKKSYLTDAPDYVQLANTELQNVYFDFMLKKRRLELYDDKFFEFTNSFGEEVTIDLSKIVNVRGAVSRKGGSDEDIERAALKNKEVMNLVRDITIAKRQYYKVFGLKAQLPRKIVELTPFMLNLFGKYYTIEDVKRLVKEKKDMDISYDELKRFFVGNKDVIEKRRTDYLTKNRSFRIATETGRLEILNSMMVEMEIKYRQTGQIDYSREQLKILEQARKEIKGQEVKLTIDGQIDINASLHGMNNVLASMKTLSVNSIVIGLTAAKVGLDPGVLIAQLASSWYRNMNGFNSNVIGSEQIMLPSALIKQYDWGVLKQESQKFINDFKPITEVTEVSIEEEENVEEKRERLLGALNKLKTMRHENQVVELPASSEVRSKSVKNDKKRKL